MAACSLMDVTPKDDEREDIFFSKIQTTTKSKKFESMLFYIFLTFIPAIQINRLFDLPDVIHLVKARTPPPKVNQVAYGDLKGYFVSTKMPTHAVLSFESNRIHLFLHDNKSIRRCVWDGSVTFDDKKEIMYNMMTWWNENRTCFDHMLINYEDGEVFTDVKRQIQEDKVSLFLRDLQALDLSSMFEFAEMCGIVVPVNSSRVETLALIENAVCSDDSDGD